VQASQRVVHDGRPVPKGGGTYKVGDPYQIGGQWFTPREDPGYDRRGIASFYAEDFHGRRTANGEIFDMWALSAAHPTLPLPSYVHVTNLENGRTLLLRVNDRGPYAHNRVIDLSRAAARYLGAEHRGLVQVQVRYAGPAPLSGDDRREQRFLASQPWFTVALSRPLGYPLSR
jgi:rare lipoprotein A